MTTTIAISGKGGTGKTTLAALLVRWLNDHGRRSVLAVDADPNVNLHDLLGVGGGQPIGTIREEMKEKVSALPGGMTKQEFLEYKIHEGLVETENFDLITMGRPEGPGCYCYANSLLRDILKTLSDNYEYVVIDNEAGMEHLSRRTAQRIDLLLIVAEPSVRSIQTAGRISRLLKELDTRVGRKGLIINRARGRLPDPARGQMREEGLDLFGVLPDDPGLAERDARGEAVQGVSASPDFLKALDGILSDLIAL
jgi:CO dehydrogenase maturation factor